MSDPTTPAPEAPKAAPAASAASSAPKPKPRNPALVMMGMPNIRAKLPSRNWTIFLTLTTSFLSLVAYDRYRVRQLKHTYTTLVSPLSDLPLPPSQLPRKITVLLTAPPGDTITAAREHFRDYVKPVLNAAGLDFDVVEGRQMGELQGKVRERIRRERRGEVEVENEKERAVEEWRKMVGMAREGGEEGRGWLVVGRGAWKEWVAGVNEGWLAPLEDPPSEPLPEKLTAPVMPTVEKLGSVVGDAAEKAAEVAGVETGEMKDGEEKKEEEKKEEEKPDYPTFPPLVKPEEYASRELPANIPPHLPPAAAVPFPHLLGFLNTPIRMYRYVNRRHFAEVCYREAAAVAFGVSRPFLEQPKMEGMNEENVKKGMDGNDRAVGELEDALEWEEGDWMKKVWKEDRYIGVWREGVKCDERIRPRLRRYVLDSAMEMKAKEIEEGKTETPKEE